MAWRVGTRIPENVYDGDRPVCQCHTAADAMQIVVAMNGAQVARPSLLELHEKLTSHLFPEHSNVEEHFLALALAGEVGEVCNMVKKRWRDGADLTEEIRDEIADSRMYLELLAKC